MGGLVLGIAGIVFAPQMLLWMNTPEELIAESVLYVRVYFSGLIFIFIYNMAAPKTPNGMTRMSKRSNIIFTTLQTIR